MNNSMVAHLWANQQKESAYGSHFYFEGKSIYSYGTHFEVGRIVENKRGERAYLVNMQRRSASTSTHQYYVRRSIPTGSKVFSIGDNMGTGDMGFVVSQLETIKRMAEKYKKARTEISYRYIWEPFESLMDYIEFFDMGTPNGLLRKNANEWLGAKHELARKPDRVKQEHVRELKRIFRILLDHQSLKTLGTVNIIVDEICGNGTWAKYVDRHQRWHESQKARWADAIRRKNIEDEARKKTLEERIQIWKMGKTVTLDMPWSYFNDEPNAWLRVKDGKVETSKGVKLLTSEAQRLWSYIKLLHNGAQFKHELVLDASGNAWKVNNYHNDILIAGCHRIAYSEMEGIAKQLGLE